MTTEELRSRAQDKAVSKLLVLERELEQAYRDLERGGNGCVGPDLLEVVVQATGREIAVWRFILESTQNYGKN